MKKIIEPKKCYCGADAIVIKDKKGFYVDCILGVNDGDCERYKTKKDAIEAWNKSEDVK